MVTQVLTVQCKLTPTGSQADEIEDTLKAFADACNWINQNTPARFMGPSSKVRDEYLAANNAKAEVIRTQALNDSGFQVWKYLKYLDENIEALNTLLKSADCIKIEIARGYIAVSQAHLKSLATVLEFIKPES